VKVLVIRFSSIGDIVLTTPVIRCLKQQIPGISLHYFTKATFKDIVANNPYIDKVHYLRDYLSPVIDELKKEKFDYVIDLHHNLRTLRVKKALGVKNYSFDKLNLQKWLLVNFKINLMPDKSIVERYLETVRPLGVKNDTRGLDYFIPESVKISRDDIPMSHWHGYIACVIGGSYFTKKLPVEQWKKLCGLVSLPLILIGGPEDREEGSLIAAIDPVKIYNSCGKFSLNESAELVKHAKMVISNDTGFMHIAAAFQKPVISLWGNTSPNMGMFPYYDNNNLKEKLTSKSIIVENIKLSCHPCSKIGYNKCPKGHFKCMKELNMGFIADEIKKVSKFSNHPQK